MPTGRDEMDLDAVRAHFRNADMVWRDDILGMGSTYQAWKSIPGLLAEVERLRGRIASALAVVDDWADERSDSVRLVMLPMRVRAALDGAGMDANPIPDGGDDRG